MKEPISVYFAGKIAKNDWRHGIVPNLRNSWFGVCSNPADPREIEPIRFEFSDTVLDYAGPFLVACDHGCFHGAHAHGIATEEMPESGYGLERLVTFKLCLSWLRKAHAVFAHVESGDAQGTLFELGWAYNRLPVFLNFACVEIARECWFAAQGASAVSVNPDPRAALQCFLPAMRLCRESN